MAFGSLVGGLTGVAVAHDDHFYNRRIGIACPELDPSSVISGLSLLAAGLVVWRGRKGKKPDNH
jgi:hypothetical protein